MPFSFHNVVAVLAHLFEQPLVVRCVERRMLCCPRQLLFIMPPLRDRGLFDWQLEVGLFAIVADTNANMLLLGDEAIGAR